MKRMIIALLLLGFIFCMAFVTSCLAENAIDKTCIALNACTMSEKSLKDDASKISEAMSEWSRNKRIIYAVMFHDDFFEIEKNMVELESLTQQNDFSNSCHLCVKIEMLLKNKKEEINVSFENIF